MRAPNWTEPEFDILLDSYELSHQDLCSLLPRRTRGAIEVVREGVHSYHTGGGFGSALSKMMTDRLEQRRGSLICWKCRDRF